MLNSCKSCKFKSSSTDDCRESLTDGKRDQHPYFTPVTDEQALRKVRTRRSRGYVVVAVLLFIAVFFFILHLIISQFQVSSPVGIDINKPLGKVSRKFLSVALDTDVIRDRHICHISSFKFHKRAQPLAPAYFRIGGNSADALTFNENGLGPDEDSLDCSVPSFDRETREDFSKIDISNFTMSGKEWDVINNFTDKAGFQLIFDLNALLRSEDGWNSSNAYSLLNYSTSFGTDIIWQLGNEPNAFRHVFGVPVSPAALAQDYRTLRKVLNKFPEYNNSWIVGPEVTRPQHLSEPPLEYLQEFLNASDKDTVNAVTWHQYYLNGRTATLTDFISPKVLNLLQKQIAAVKMVADVYMPGLPVWLTETSSAYGGGAPGLSDAFVAGFMWLDKLGMAAKMGIDVVIRQALYYGNYSLIDVTTMDPLPDWWLSVLYKQLVGQTVLDLNHDEENGFIRLYAHCSSDDLKSKGGVVTIFGMNLKEIGKFIRLIGFPTTHQNEAFISSYTLTGTHGLLSRNVLLNGKVLLLEEDESLPDFDPVIVDVRAPIYLQPYSLNFWVIHNVNVPACAK